MEIEVFPTTQGLTVTAGNKWVYLTQHDEVLGKDVQIFIPVHRVEETCRALRATAEAASEGLED